MTSAFVKDITFSSGFITVTFDSGSPRKYPIADVLRALDIPEDLLIGSLPLLTKLAQVVMVITQTLIDNGTLGEHLIAGFDLDYIRETLVDDLEAEEVSEESN